MIVGALYVPAALTCSSTVPAPVWYVNARQLALLLCVAPGWIGFVAAGTRHFARSAQPDRRHAGAPRTSAARGLAIDREISEHRGGSLVLCDSPKGACFLTTFPLANRPGLEPPPARPGSGTGWHACWV